MAFSVIYQDQHNGPKKVIGFTGKMLVVQDQEFGGGAS